jgi:uncharacterized protein (DUF697 family)
MPGAIAPSAGESNAVTKALLDLVSRIPTSSESINAAPKRRAQAIASATAKKAAGVSGTLALPPGPFGLATVVPDLLVIWRLQQSMVADIAAVYGKSAFLGKETMIFCLFKHGAAALMRDLVVRIGGRYLVRRTALKVIQQILKKMGVEVTQRIIGKGLSRWIPVLGAVGAGAYAYYDTTQVAATAIELFSKDIEVTDSKERNG